MTEAIPWLGMIEALTTLVLAWAGMSLTDHYWSMRDRSKT